MRIQKGPLWLDLPPELVDEALLVASRSVPESLRKQFLEQREAISTIETVDIREESFRQLDAEWAERLGIGDALRDLLSEKDVTSGAIRGCIVKRVRAAADESASLEADVLYLTLKVDTLLSPERLRAIVGPEF